MNDAPRDRTGYRADVPKPKEFDADFFRSVIDYDQETGEMRWKKRIGPMNPIGSVVGWKEPTGYQVVSIFGKKVRLHRLAWVYVNGEWPKNEIDHINGIRDDNRISNLRDATSSVNNQNKRSALSSNKSSSLLGVSRKNSGWRAQILANGAKRHLGIFATAEEAHEAYLKAKRELHHGCTI